MKDQKKIRNELWRADIYRLLALGLDTPSQNNLNALETLLVDLNSVECPKTFSEKLSQLKNDFKNERRELTEEYTLLFVTKSECPLSEGSYHLAERGPVLGDVTAFYEAFRIKFHEKSGPPDSMKMELGFLSYLALKKVYALENKLTEAFQITEDAEKKFLNDHLGRWGELFANRLEKTTDKLFYKTLGTLLNAWIKAECARFRIVPTILPTSLSSTENENCMGIPV